MLYEADIDVKSAQEWAGHATVGILMDIYTHLSNEKKLEAADKLRAFASTGNCCADFDDNFDDNDDNLTTKRLQMIVND